VTEPRRAVLEALARLPDHPTAEQIVGAVEASAPAVHRATVYRTLETFTDLGIVTHVHVGHGPTNYHLAEQHHLHAQCQRCGRVVDLPAEVLDDVQARMATLGFELDATHVALSGLCAQCRPPAGDYPESCEEEEP